MTTLDDKIEAVSAALIKQPPFCTGVVELDEDSATLFYKKEDYSASFLSLISANEENLRDLTETCLPAKFGLGNQDVYDETYRKARKMDVKNFKIGFDPSPMMSVIEGYLLDGKYQKTELELELYQLNVYDKGSFFKAHRDTPRSRYMFASLVVVFPVSHEGGQLLLRHDDEEWAFDASQLLSQSQTPSAAFIAFYSDVEHEVTMVESGYCVTLTYNIYGNRPDTGKETTASMMPIMQSVRSIDASLFKATISDLLQDPECLPDGGYFGFGLRFLYPAFGGADLDLNYLLEALKGTDEVIRQVCTSLSLKTSLRVFIEGDSDSDSGFNFSYLLDSADSLTRCGQAESLDELFSLTYSTKIYDWTERDDVEDAEEGCAVLWLSPATSYVEFNSDYIAYGTGASVSDVYGEVCLVAEVGAFSKRETQK